MRILVTDGPNNNTLTILRTLGKKHNLEITSHLPVPVTLGAYSKYCRRVWPIASAPHNLTAYSRELLKIFEREKFDLLLPVGLNSYLAASMCKAEFQQVTRVVAADFENMQTAYRRDKAMSLAEAVLVPTPRFYNLYSEDISLIDRYPVVIKASEGGTGSVKYCNNARELEKSFDGLIRAGRTGIIAQEYVSGFACGFFGLYDNSKLVAYFMHKRIKEFPVTGGPSAVAESFFDERLLSYGKKLGEALRWHGPIMAEFKYDSSCDDFKLIEINPKLWGSLDLTIAAGVNVPEMLTTIALGEKVSVLPGYDNVRYRWVFPDEWKALTSSLSFRDFRAFFRKDPGTRTNLDFSDPLPTVLQVFRGLMEGGLLLLSPRKRRPHGKVTCVHAVHVDSGPFWKERKTNRVTK